MLVIGRGGETDLAEVWDPRTSTFEQAGALSEGHPEHTATLLPGGRVLVIGGMATFPVELWDPVTASFTIVGRLEAETGGHTATPLPDGSILMIGGYDMRLKRSYDTASIVRPPWDTVAPSERMGQARAGHSQRDAATRRPRARRRRHGRTWAHGREREPDQGPVEEGRDHTVGRTVVP